MATTIIKLYIVLRHTVVMFAIFEVVSSCNHLPRRRKINTIEFDINSDKSIRFYTDKDIRIQRHPGTLLLNNLTGLFAGPLIAYLKSNSGIETQRRDNDVVAISKGKRVVLYLYTLKNREKGEILPNDIKNSRYWNKNAKVKIFIHGYLQTANIISELERVLKETPQIIKNAYLEMNRTENIVLVDWKEFARTLNYFNAIRDIFAVGLKVAEFIKSLIEEKMTRSYDDIHVIGFSLGGQAAGIVGFLVHQHSGRKVGRITGLDPAGPGFEFDVDKMYRLDKDDAIFVDVIHCSAGDLFSETDRFGRLGTKLLSGDVDFFPNGGIMQPGCADLFLDICSHLRCTKLFVDTIRGVSFATCPCSISKDNDSKGKCDCRKTGAVVGEFCPRSAKGIHYVNTFAQR